MIDVRRLQDEDYADWLKLFRAYIAFYRTEVADDVIENTFRRLITQSDDMVGLVAFDSASAAASSSVAPRDDATSGPQLLGLAHLVFHASTWSPTSYCYLEDLFVTEPARGRGVGRKLIDATYALADERGATRTYWATEANNATARRLYDAVGNLSPFVQYRR